ncbi:MAG: hypothetical protein U0939_05190 [Pirellulales bacterium]
MRSIAAAITIVSFCLHALFGCCAHHAHADEATSCGNVLLGASHVCTHGHDHDGQVVNSAHDCQTHAPRHSHEGCQDVACTFVLEVKAPVTGIDLAAAFTVVAIGCTSVTAPVAAVTLAIAGSENDTAPPVPLYLMNQVLLT